MEYLAVLLALATGAMATNTAEHIALQAKIVTAGEACIEEYPISGEDITSFKSGQFPDSEHAGCFSACVLRNIGLPIIGQEASVGHLVFGVHWPGKFVVTGKASIGFPMLDVAIFKSCQFHDSKHASGFSTCVLRNIDLFDDKGSLYQADNLEKAAEIFKEEKEIETIKELINTCFKVNEENVTDGEKGCERAKLLFHCFIENSNE